MSSREPATTECNFNQKRNAVAANRVNGWRLLLFETMKRASIAMSGENTVMVKRNGSTERIPIKWAEGQSSLQLCT